MLFQYTNITRDTIRLIRFLPYSTSKDIYVTFEHQSRYFDDDVHYTAISYDDVGGGTKKPITLNGRAFMISSNLFHGLAAILQHHRTNQDERFWVNAICINHQDMVEKNSQIQQLWRIFGSADRALSWIGSEHEHTSSLFTCIQQKLAVSQAASLAAQVATTNEPPKICRHESKDTALAEVGQDELTLILSNDYFSRAWTRPEVLQARAAYIIQSSHQCSYIDLHHFLNSNGSEMEFSGSAVSELIRFGAGVSGVPIQLLISPAKQFYYLVCKYSSLHCSDPRDTVFALLNDPQMKLLPDHDFLKVDYNISADRLAQQCASYYELV